MKLKCISRFRNHEHSFEPGQDINISDEAGALLMRCSPESFEVPGPPKENPEPVEVPEPIAAMSTETETGIVAPDRRARGGKKRATKRSKKN